MIWLIAAVTTVVAFIVIVIKGRVIKHRGVNRSISIYNPLYSRYRIHFLYREELKHFQRKLPPLRWDLTQVLSYRDPEIRKEVRFFLRESSSAKAKDPKRITEINTAKTTPFKLVSSFLIFYRYRLKGSFTSFLPPKWCTTLPRPPHKKLLRIGKALPTPAVD